MYCKECGKFIGDNSDLCDECKAKVNAPEEEVKVEVVQPTQNYQSNAAYTAPIRTGYVPPINLGNAIAANVLGYVGFIIMYIGLVVSTAMIYSDAIGGAIACLILGIAPAVIGLILGIKSIFNFKETAALKSGKRIPVLILGIVATANAAVTLFMALILFFMVVAIGLGI